MNRQIGDYNKMMDKMDSKVINIVKNYVINQHNSVISDFDVYIVWKCKTLQNWKYLLSTTLIDGMYYELTYNGDKEEFYLDAYEKVENKVIKDM